MVNIISMKPKKRQKLCHNCEGEIDLDVIVCPFCAADLREEKPEQGRPPFSPQHFNQHTSQSLYPSPFPTQTAEPSVPESPPETPAAAIPEAKSPFIATVLFTLGVQLFLLGLLMLLFSHRGAIVLRWDASYWFLYCIGGLPFLYFGYKALLKL